MTLAEISTIGGIAVAIITAIVALIKGRADAATGKRALDKQIDDRVELQLKGAWAQIDAQKGEIEALKSEMAEVRRERAEAVSLVDEIRSIVHRWVESLLAWHREGHHGDIPLPSEADAVTLRIPRSALPNRERRRSAHDPVD